MDRIDLQVDVPPVTAADLSLPPPAEGTAEAAARVAQARALQEDRAAEAGDGAPGLNARAEGGYLEKVNALDDPARALLARAAHTAYWERADVFNRVLGDFAAGKAEQAVADGLRWA